MATLFHSHVHSRNEKLIGLAGWLLISFVTAGIGSIASIQAAEFYSTQLRLPEWAPAASVFGPVWTVLYAMMGVSAWLVWLRSGVNDAYVAFTLFIMQLALNALWSWLFFVWKFGGLAFADVTMLWVVVAAMVVAFWRHSRTAAVLLVPYLLWITFAAALNYSVWQMNRDVLSGG